MIEPTRPFDENTVVSPPEPFIDKRNASEVPEAWAAVFRRK